MSAAPKPYRWYLRLFGTDPAGTLADHYIAGMTTRPPMGSTRGLGGYGASRPTDGVPVIEVGDLDAFMDRKVAAFFASKAVDQAREIAA